VQAAAVGLSERWVGVGPMVFRIKVGS